MRLLGGAPRGAGNGTKEEKYRLGEALYPGRLTNHISAQAVTSLLHLGTGDTYSAAKLQASSLFRVRKTQQCVPAGWLRVAETDHSFVMK